MWYIPKWVKALLITALIIAAFGISSSVTYLIMYGGEEMHKVVSVDGIRMDSNGNLAMYMKVSDGTNVYNAYSTYPYQWDCKVNEYINAKYIKFID